jgi:hypothetical protein
MFSEDNNIEVTNNKIAFDELVIFIPIVTAAIYISLSVYFQMYFRTIGFEQNLLNLNLDFYLINGVIPVFVVLIIFSLTILSASILSWWSSLWSVFPNFIFLFVIASWLFDFTPDDKGAYPSIFFITAIILFIFAILLIPIGGKLLSSGFFFNDSLSWKLYTILRLFFICSIISMGLGQYMGNQFVNGNSSDATQVHFIFTNESTQHFSDDIRNESFLLVTYRENCYYVIPMNKSKIKHNSVYIIPDHEVVSSRLERLH